MNRNPSFRCVKITVGECLRYERERDQPPPAAGRRRRGRGAGGDRPRRPARRPRPGDRGRPCRRATAASGHAGHGELPARHLRRRARGRPPRQRLRPDRDAARLRLRQDAAAGQRPAPARMGDRRPGQGDRSRARGQVRGLDLQRPRPRADPAGPRGRAAADPLRQRLRTPAHDALPRHPPRR